MQADQRRPSEKLPFDQSLRVVRDGSWARAGRHPRLGPAPQLSRVGVITPGSDETLRAACSSPASVRRGKRVWTKACLQSSAPHHHGFQAEASYQVGRYVGQGPLHSNSSENTWCLPKTTR